MWGLWIKVSNCYLGVCVCVLCVDVFGSYDRKYTFPAQYIFCFSS